MDAQLVMTVEEMQNKKAWLKMRRTGLGGSDIASMLGMSSWKSPYALWQEKISTDKDIDEDDDEAQELNEYIHFGIKLEQIVADEFEERTGKKLRRCGLLRNNNYPFVLASVDRLVVGEDAGLECKTTSSWKKEEWTDDNVPDAYYLQCQWYMLATGFPKWYIACLIGGNRFEWKEIKRNDKDIDIMLQTAKKFWEENVIAKKLPTIDGTEYCTKALREMFPGGGIEALELNGETDVMLNDLQMLKEDRKRLDKVITLKENQLREMLGNYEFARSARYNVWYKAIRTTTFNKKQLKRDYPDIYQKYEGSTSVRKLLVKISKARTKEED